MAKGLQDRFSQIQAMFSRHFKGLFLSGMWKFDPCMVSQTLRILEKLLLLRRKGLRIAAFRVPQISTETDVRTITFPKSAGVSS